MPQTLSFFFFFDWGSKKWGGRGWGRREERETSSGCDTEGGGEGGEWEGGWEWVGGEGEDCEEAFGEFV